MREFGQNVKRRKMLESNKQKKDKNEKKLFIRKINKN